MTTDPNDLRQRIAEALLTRIKRATVSRTQPHDAFTSLLAANEYDLADAVLAVLPPPADRAAVLLAAVERLERINPDRSEDFSEGVDWALDELRRVAGEAHSCGNCEGINPDTCLMNPHRPPEQCPNSEFDGYGQQCQKPAGHNLCTFEEQPAVSGPRAADDKQDGAHRG